MRIKKTLAVIALLALIFAVAAPALAGIGFLSVALPDLDVAYEVIGLSHCAGVLRTNNSMTYDKYDQSIGMLEGSDVTFLVIFTIKEQAAAAAYKQLGGNILYIETSNLRPDASPTCIAYTIDRAGDTVPLAASGTNAITLDDFTTPPALLNADMAANVTWKGEAELSLTDIEQRNLTLYILYQGYELDQSSNATVTVGWRSSSGKLQVNGSLTLKSGGSTYLASHTKANRALNGARLTSSDATVDHVFEILIQSGQNTGASVAFFCHDADGANYDIVHIAVDATNASRLTSLVGRTYAVGFTAENGVDFTPYGANLGWLTDSHESYPALKGILDEVFSVFGWSYDGSLGHLNDDGFGDYSGAAVWIYYAYTDRLAIPGGLEIPDTGGAPLGLLFVPAALILAAAALRRRRGQSR